ncbi:MAG: hypothetical protein IJL87_03435 [Clostridia bacterium]|nr:hypothetical protein [Clostridia bacterium]
MKTYEQMAQDALTRIKDYKAEQTRKRKAAAKIAAPLACLCVLTLLGAAIFGGHLIKPVQTAKKAGEEKIVQETTVETAGDDKDCLPETKEVTAEGAEDICQMLGSVELDGKIYVEITADVSVYSKGEYLGKASDYEGYYKSYSDVDGELYKSAEDEKILLVFLENGDTVVLKQTDEEL